MPTKKRERTWQLYAAIATVAGTVIALLTYFKPDSQPTVVNNVTLPKIENNARLEANTKSTQTVEPLSVTPAPSAAPNATSFVETNSLPRLQVPPPPTDGTQTNGVPTSDDFPGLGKSWQITLGANSPKRGGMGAYKEFLVIVNQGDRLRVKAEPVGGASMRIRFEVFTGVGDKSIEYPKKTGTLDWTMTKGIPGDSARVRIYSDVLGQINVTVSKAN